MAAFEYTSKQLEVMRSLKTADNILIGGAKGGGKSQLVICAMAFDVVEMYSRSEAKKMGIDYEGSGYHVAVLDGEPHYFKYLIDYPDYFGVFVRRTESALISSTVKLAKQIYKEVGGVWIKSEMLFRFPSGAEIVFKAVNKPDHLDWFQGPPVHRLAIEELTQFTEEEVDFMESCCRAPSTSMIKAKRLHSTNPGGRGHTWVKKKYFDVCRPVKVGEPEYLERFDLWWQSMKMGEVANIHGERRLFIPMFVFDNPYIQDDYIFNLLNKNELLRQMYLFGNWDVYVGQFFGEWDERFHVLSEREFFGSSSYDDLPEKRLAFDWSEYRLYVSNDYGFAKEGPWACGFYAVHNETDDIIKFGEIVESGLTIWQQLQRTKEVLNRDYGLDLEKDFEAVIADPQSYWRRRDTADGEFWTFASVYEADGIYLTAGLNDRAAGAGAFAEAIRIRETGKPQYRVLDCCEYTIETIPELPPDKNNPNMVDTKVKDHAYDADRYFLMVLRGDAVSSGKETRRDRFGVQKLFEHYANSQFGGTGKSWKCA